MLAASNRRCEEPSVYDFRYFDLAQHRFGFPIVDCRTRVGADLRVGPPNGRTPFDSAQGRRRSAPTLACCLLHLMTRFASARKSGESVRPICFAAFRLITNSNFVACCTGKSAGLAPLRPLSTELQLRWQHSQAKRLAQFQVDGLHLRFRHSAYFPIDHRLPNRSEYPCHQRR